jgi:acyl-CoA synthetase (AMP-forming)/AMP-acid ligase II
VNLNLILEMAAGGYGDRVALGSRKDGISFAELARRAGAGASALRVAGVGQLLMLMRNGPALPQALFAAAVAGIPCTPLNYRLPR